jgi:hypothetical protein
MAKDQFLKDGYGTCKTCLNAKRTCFPLQICVICDRHGIGLTKYDIETISIIGCYSYTYDNKGITDLDRYHSSKIDALKG